MTTNCPVCKTEAPVFFRAKDFNRKITAEVFPYYRCSSCGLIFLSPIPNDLGKYYPHDYYPIPTSVDKLAKAAECERYKIDIVKQFASNGRLLEIGPAYGCFLYLAKQAGFEAEAIEMDVDCCRFLQEKIGVKAINSNDPSDALKAAGEYDVIALWHVIEHLPDPWKTLEAIGGKMRPGGILVIAAPNPDAFQFRVLGRFWPHVDAPRHLSLIPMPLLTRQLRLLGLKTIWSTNSDKGSLSWNSFGWAHFFGNFSRSYYVKLMLRIIGRITGIILCPLDRMAGRGSAYTVVFQKEQ